MWKVLVPFSTNKYLSFGKVMKLSDDVWFPKKVMKLSDDVWFPKKVMKLWDDVWFPKKVWCHGAKILVIIMSEAVT